MKLKLRHLIDMETQANTMEIPILSDDTQGPSTETQAELNENYEDVDFDTIEDSDVENTQSLANEEYYLNYYADFLNRLTNMKFIPFSTVTEIAQEY